MDNTSKPKGRALIDISEEMLALEDALLESEGEIDQHLEAWFNDLTEERDEKLDDYAALIRTVEAREKIRREEVARMEELARVDKNLITRLKKGLQTYIDAHGGKAIHTKRFRLSVAGNGGAAPLLFKEGASPENAPSQFRKTKYEWNNDAIREYLENTGPLEFASIGERGRGLRIK